MIKRAQQALDDAKASEEGRMFTSMDTILYSAFAMEAFINHIGAELYDDWEETERSKSKHKKLKDLKSKLNITTNKQEEPYKSVTDAFNFRDLLAHGRTETIHETVEVKLTKDELKTYTVDSLWMKLSTLENADRILANIKTVITEMFTSAELGKYPFLHFHASTRTVKLLD